MAYNLKKELEKPETSGRGAQTLCRMRRRDRCTRRPAVRWSRKTRRLVTNATGCLEVSTFIYPHTAYYDSYIHTAFANAAATMLRCGSCL